jgi:hypothetical protein
LEDLLSLVDANETQIDAAGVNLLRYIAPGDEHDVLGDGPFDTGEVNGEMVVYWVTKADRERTGRRRALHRGHHRPSSAAGHQS